MAAQVGDTYAHALRKVLSDLAVAGTLPDADLQFNSQMQQVITGFLRQTGVDQATAQMGMGAAPVGPPSAPPPGAGGAPQGLSMTGGGPGAGMPNPDELRRLLSGAGAG